MQTPDTPQWPDGGARPPGVVYVPPGVNVQHECPPDRVTMLQNLTELQASYDTRLANQAQVIENLSQARKAALDQLDQCQRFIADLLDNNALSGETAVAARRLVQWEE